VIGVANEDSFTPVVSDNEVLLLSISEESFAHQMVSTPLKGHPVTMDIDDVVSSIHGNLPCVCFVASAVILIFLQYLYCLVLL